MRRSGRPINPYLVLLLAILLPGVGHIAIGQPQRGMVFAFFTLLFGLLTYLVSTPEQSFVGRHAGGIFVWALSIPDAYRRARIAHAAWAANVSRLS
jgi:hypothetical protein